MNNLLCQKTAWHSRLPPYEPGSKRANQEAPWNSSRWVPRLGQIPPVGLCPNLHKTAGRRSNDPKKNTPEVSEVNGVFVVFFMCNPHLGTSFVHQGMANTNTTRLGKKTCSSRHFKHWSHIWEPHGIPTTAILMKKP